jgi:hypothetical protein
MFALYHCLIQQSYYIKAIILLKQDFVNNSKSYSLIPTKNNFFGTKIILINLKSKFIIKALLQKIRLTGYKKSVSLKLFYQVFATDKNQ